MEKIKSFFLQNTTTKQTIVKNVLWLSTGVSLGKIARSVVVIYSARILGTEGYGVFSYAISLAAVFNIFSDIGLSQLLIRELVKREDSRAYLATSFVVKLALVALSTISIALISSHFTNIEQAKPLMLIMALMVAFDGIRGFLFCIPRSQNRMQVEAMFEIITEVLITGTGLFILFKIPSIWNLSLGYMIASGMALLILMIAMRKYLADTLSNFRKDLVPVILKSAGPFAFMAILGVFMTNIDSVILGFLGTTHDLGLLAAAQRPISLLYLIPGFLSTSLLPFMSKFTKDADGEKFSTLLKKSTTVALLIALPVTVGGMIVAGPVINVVYGYEYIGAVIAFRILLATMIPVFPGIMFSSALLVMDKQKIFVKSGLVGALTNLGLDLLLIPMYGIAGSAIATLCTQLAVNGILLYEIRKTNKIKMGRDYYKIMLALVVMTLVVFITKALLLPLLLIILLGGAIYFGTLVLLKEEIISEIKGGFTS